MYTRRVISQVSPPRKFDYDLLARQLVRAIRGSNSQTVTSRAIGYRSNIFHRWECGECMPTAAGFLSAWRLLTREPEVVTRFLGRSPEWAKQTAPASPQGVALFLSDLAGRTAVAEIAEELGISRYRVSRVLSGRTEPKLPFFLELIEVLSRRLLDFLSLLVRIERLSSISHHWRQLELARELAYEQPWSHAVLRALELGKNAPRSGRWLAACLGLPLSEVDEALERLVRAGQVERKPRGYRLRQAATIDTSRDPRRARQLRLAWCDAAVKRLASGHPGHFGYSLFAVSRADMRRLRELHTQYLRAMQNLIASSREPECVGLFCSQLVDLRPGEHNALLDGAKAS
jgi:DNA-binding MarR family transcriptional regulator